MLRCWRTSLLPLALALATLAGASPASAQATLINGLGGDADFGTLAMAVNDDDSSLVINLTGSFPAGLRFYGTTHTSLYINNNGNLTFSGPLSMYTPVSFPVASRPMIAPFWGDVDTRGRTGVTSAENNVYYHLSAGRLVVTWYNVGFYNSKTNKLNSFQLILTDRSSVGVAGDFDVEFRYNRCEWTTGAASGGDANGQGGTPAQAGLDAGDSTNYQALPGSGTAAVLNLCTTSNVGSTGVWRYQVRPGGVTQCGNGIIESGEACDDGNTTNGDGCNERCAIELTPGNTCTADIQCRSGECVDGVCCNRACDGQCEACNRAGSVGTCGPVTGAPLGGRAACSGTGTCGGTCNGTLATACTFPGSSTSCDDGLFCTAGDRCNGSGSCGGSARDCGDGLSCTSDSCDETNDRCVNAVTTGCAISGSCIAAGTANAANACLVCDPTRSTTSWSPASAGTSCDDGLFCTTGDQCNATGVCAGSARDCGDGLSCTTDSCDEAADACVSTHTSGCLVDGACFGDGAANPANTCQVCDESARPTAWSNAASGTSCDDGLFCTTGDVCDGDGACGGAARDCGDGNDCTLDECDEAASACVSRVVDTCEIDGMCVPDTMQNPANPCEICDPTRSTSAWSLREEGASCDDGLFCTTGDVCTAEGACEGTARDCSDEHACTADVCDESEDACTHDVESGCLIRGECLAEDAASTDDACLVCDPTQSTSGYSPSSAPECTNPDGGVPDGGVADAGMADAGVGGDDAGDEPGGFAGGACGCSVPGTGTGSGTLPLALSIFGLVAFSLRRRARKGNVQSSDANKDA